MARRVEHVVSVELPPFRKSDAAPKPDASERQSRRTARQQQTRRRAVALREQLRRILDFRKNLESEKRAHLSMAARAAELLAHDPTRSEPPTEHEIEAWRHAYASAAHAAEERCQRFDEQMIARLGTQDVLKRLESLTADFVGLTETEPPLVRKQQAIADAYDSLLPVAETLYNCSKAGESWPDLGELLLLNVERPTPDAFVQHVARLRTITGTDDELRLHLGYAATAMSRAIPARSTAFWHERLTGALREPAVANMLRKGKGGAKLATMHWIAAATRNELTWGTVRDYRKAVEKCRETAHTAAAR